MKIKELQKTVNIAWSPRNQNPIYLAAGTAAQQLDSNATSTLEIYSTNFQDPSYDLELKASLPSQYRFQKLIWSATGSGGGPHSNGLLVGGCEGGHIMIYSPSKMLANEEGLVARQDKHTGPVTGLDINPFQTNLLASCASESEIFIWDLNNTATHMNPGAKTQPLEDVQNVAWNRQVQHILASVFSSRCVIWDLRKSEQIMKLSDTQSRVRWHAIQWHPDVATQVWLASEDDQAPVVQLWDLRYATAPAKTMQIHQRGVLGMSWCPQDSDLMVSCGKDNRIYCWNPNTEAAEGDILSEVAVTGTWYSNVQWCPRNPALIASSSLDGNVSIYSLFGGTQQQVQTSNKIADSFPGMDQFAQAPMPQQSTQIVYHDLKRAPKWIKRPAGVQFGFGGKLVSFNGSSKSVKIEQVITEPDLVERASSLERSLAESSFVDYCRQRADQTSDQNGRYLWYFIKANFELNPKEEMLNLLGYNREDIDSKFSQYTKEEEASSNDVDQLTNRISTMTHSESSVDDCDQSSDGSCEGLTQTVDNNAIFDDIAAGQQEQNKRDEAAKAKRGVGFKIPTGDHPDSLITEALLTGNLEAAVELCLSSKRTAEALIIASTAGIEYLQRIQNRYLSEQHGDSELSHVIAALVERDWLAFVNDCSIDSWKEALVAALKHSDRKVVDICERLGDRLLSERSSSVEAMRNAMLCYVCAGSIDKLVTAWYQLKQLETANPQYKLNTGELQELAEVVMLMSKSLEQQGVAVELSGRCAEFIAEYGGLLASQGALTAALSYIFTLGSTEHPELSALRERIYNTVHYKPQQAQTQAAAPRGYQQQTQQQQQQPQSLYGRAAQQQPRGSFSMPQTQPLAAGPYAPAPAANTFNANPWNSPPGVAAPAVGNPMAAAPPLMSPPSAPTIFNPAMAATSPPAMPPAKGPQINDNLSQPPRPLSAASSQGGAGAAPPSSSGGSGLLSRSKYVLDPSVAAAGPMGGGYGGYQPPAVAPGGPMAPVGSMNPYNQSSMYGGGAGPVPAAAPIQPLSFNTSPFGGQQQQQQQQPLGNSYLPGVPPIETMPQQAAPPPMQSMARNPTPPPGWNDPPALKSSRAPYYNPINEMSAKHAGTRKWAKIINHELANASTLPTRTTTTTMADQPGTAYSSSPLNIGQPGNGPFYVYPQIKDTFLYQQPKKVEAPQPAAPITHPLFGVDPNQNQNGYMDPNAQYQQNPGMMPPPQAMGNYLNPSVAPTQPMNNNMMPGQQSQQPQHQQQQFPQQMNFQTSAVPGMQSQQQQQQQQQPIQTQRQPEPPKEKAPLPEEYIYLQTVLEELKTHCLTASTDPRMKRKFVDVAKRLENLYDCLRDGRLTPTTIGILNQIVQYIQVGDYNNAMQTQTQIAFGSDFSQCAGFMPGLKVLVQSANDLQIYLR